MRSSCYVDTSALAKRYIEEPGSAGFDAFCETTPHDLVISPLVATEFAGVLRRRVRMGQMTEDYGAKAQRRFQKDVVAGGWRMIEFDLGAFGRATDLMTTLGTPLTMLDALHLACALLDGAHALATADLQLATAARLAQLEVVTFS